MSVALEGPLVSILQDTTNTADVAEEHTIHNGDAHLAGKELFVQESGVEHVPNGVAAAEEKAEEHESLASRFAEQVEAMVEEVKELISGEDHETSAEPEVRTLSVIS